MRCLRLGMYIVGFCFVLASACSASLLVNHEPFAGENEALPAGFIGAWMATNGTTAPIGPLNEQLLFTVTPLPRTGGTRWLMRHNFERVFEIHGSKQQFWVSSRGAGAAATSNTTYCGLLADFFQNPEPIEVTFTQVNRSETLLEWVLENWQVSGRWKLELINGGQQLYSYITLPDGISNHFVGTYTKISSDPYEYLDEGTKKMLSDPNSWNFTSPCNWTAPPSAPEQGAKKNEVAAKSKRRGGCPFGFGDRRVPAKRRDAPSTKKSEYQYCYKINEDMALTVAWTWNVTAEAVNVSVSARAPDGVDVSTQYVAIGFNPNWPLMQGMDIVMGYFPQDAMTGGGCIRSLYAAEDVGTPVDNPSQVITPLGVSVDSKTNSIEMRFQRPWVTGHRNLANPWGETQGIPILAFAMGNAANNCTSRPHYHYGRRGVYGFFWSQPAMALPDRMSCENAGL